MIRKGSQQGKTHGAGALRALVALLAFALLAVACGSGDGETTGDGGKTLTKIRWVYDWFPTSGDLPILAALENGYFEEAGLEVSIAPGGEEDQTQLVGIGEYDITVSPSVSVIQTHPTGLPVKAIGVVQPISPVGYICRPDVGLDPNDPTTLEGHKVGVQGPDPYYAVWQAYEEVHGIDPSKVEEVQVSFDPVVMFEGEVDCFPDFLTLVPAQAEKVFGVPPVTYWISKDVSTLGQVLVVNNDFAAENPEAVKGFVSAYAKGMQWAIQNQDEAIDLVVSTYPDLGEDVVSIELPALLEYWVAPEQEQGGLLWMSAETWQPTYDTLLTYGFLEEEFDVAAAIDTQFLPEEPILP